MDVHLTLGVRLMAGWESSITRGPPAKLPEADDFRQFWGEVSELRKFPDNAICEAVVWDEHANSPRVPFQICQHILSRYMPHRFLLRLTKISLLCLWFSTFLPVGFKVAQLDVEISLEEVESNFGSSADLFRQLEGICSAPIPVARWIKFHLSVSSIWSKLTKEPAE